MKQHNKISILKHPKIWFKDKYNTGINHKSTYFIALIPSVFIIIGLVADIRSIISFANNNLIVLLLCFLFCYGLLNLWFVTVNQKIGVRLTRDRETFKIIHKKVVEIIRDYLAFKEQCEQEGVELKKDKVKQYIKDILNSFNDNYMKHVHRPKVSVTLKYLKGENLVPIRIGDDQTERNQKSEHLNQSYVYRTLNRSGKKMSYIYVKDIENPDKYECLALGEYTDELQKRAKDKYGTFIALPIRAGQIDTESLDFTTRPDLGILGFDLKEKYGFGNFDSHEFHILGCLVDLLSVPVKDLVSLN